MTIMFLIAIRNLQFSFTCLIKYSESNEIKLNVIRNTKKSLKPYALEFVEIKFYDHVKPRLFAVNVYAFRKLIFS